MLFYVTLVLLVVASLSCFPKNKTLGLFWMCVLCFLSMFRGESVGTDTSSYMDINSMNESYEFYEDMSGGRANEYVTMNLYNFMDSYSLSPRIAIMFFSLTTFLFLFLSLKRMRLSFCIGTIVFLILFYFSSFNISRQICASSIVLYATTFLFDKTRKSFLFFIFLLLAVCVHGSSIIGIILYLFRFGKSINHVNKYVLTIIAVVLFVFNLLSPLNIIGFIASKFDSNIYMSIYSHKMQVYESSLIGKICKVALFIPLIMVFNYKRSNINSQPILDLLFYAFIITTVLSSNLDSDVARIVIPIQIIAVFYFPYLYQDDNKFIKSISFWSFILVHGFFLLWGIASGSGEIIPYVLDMSF